MVNQIGDRASRLWTRALQRVGLVGRGARGPAAAPEASTASFFYRPPSTCQIDRLGGLYEQFLGVRDEGRFVEVGAFDGETWSNTSCLAEAGWSGLLIEPVPAFAARARARYAGNPKVTIVESAAGSSPGDIELTVAGPLTTASGVMAAEYRTTPWAADLMANTSTITAHQERLDTILEDAGFADDQALDVLVVDTEGYEADVFAGFSIDRWQPTMMIVELSDTHPDLRSMRARDAQLRRAIVAAGYEVVYKDVINTVFVRTEQISRTLDV